jgi:hypothetical protein
MLARSDYDYHVGAYDYGGDDHYGGSRDDCRTNDDGGAGAQVRRRSHFRAVRWRES